MKCRVCGKEVHYCTSCDTDLLYESGFCSNECLQESGVEVEFFLLLEELKQSDKFLKLLKKIYSYLDKHPILENKFDELIEI